MPEHRFDEERDVVVVGFGGAGACASIEARDAGADVLALDRFDGGGATRLSGGVVYAGGGTSVQRAAGVDDDVAAMRAYLATEAEDAIRSATLERFCNESRAQVDWLGTLGVTFPPRLYPAKTTQPPDGFGLYASGNEAQRAAAARPAPRGHVVDGPGMTGKVLYAKLAAAAVARGVELRPHARAVRLVRDDTDGVAGVEALCLPRGGVGERLHRAAFACAAALAPVSLGLARPAMALLDGIEARFGRRRTIRARRAVVLTSGGFVFDRDRMRTHAPRYAGCMPLGTPGDVGAALELAAPLGADTGELASCAASRFFCPPEAFVGGILVNRRGERFVDETLYGATLSKAIAGQPDGDAWLVLDAAIHARAAEQLRAEERLRDHPLGQVLSGELNHLVFRKYTAAMNLRVNRLRADTLLDLARTAGIDAAGLERAVREANGAARGETDDPTGKGAAHRAPIETPPFYAIRCELASRLFPGPCITLGGLRVDGETGRVLRADGSAIRGLHAAGRAAVGVSSRSYVSGLSLADCIFSGRTAGRAAARGS